MHKATAKAILLPLAQWKGIFLKKDKGSQVFQAGVTLQICKDSQ